MHLCFIDESGTAPKPEAKKPVYFVIAGLIVPEEKWHVMSGRLQGLKSRLKFKGELKWRFFSPTNADADNPMLNWPQEQKDGLREEAFGIITRDKSVRIVACVCQAEAAYKLSTVSNQDDIYFGTYKVVTERFQYFLQDVSRTSGHNTLGIIVGDHRGKGDDDRLRYQHQRLVDETRSFTSNYGNLVEGIFLTPSHLSVGIQLADMVAGAVYRRFEADDSKWFDKIIPSFRTNSDGAIDGFGIGRFPKREWTGLIVE